MTTTEANSIAQALQEAATVRQVLEADPNAATQLNELTAILLDKCHGRQLVYAIASLVAAMVAVTPNLQGDRAVFLGALVNEFKMSAGTATIVAPGNDQVH